MTLSRFYLRLVFIPLLLFTTALFLIRTQPYDDHELRQLLLPDGCSAPCFLGIRPGVTTSKEAVKLLKANAWVADVTTINSENPYQIWWSWSQNAPDFLRNAPTNPNFPVNGEILSSNQIVMRILFTPRLRLGDIVLTKGLPSISEFIFSGMIITPSQSIPAVISLEYQAEGFWVSGSPKCPFTADLWHTPAQVTTTNDFNGISLGTVRPIDRATFMRSIRRISNLMCGL